MPKKWTSVRVVLEFPSGIKDFPRCCNASIQQGALLASCPSRNLVMRRVIQPSLSFPAPPEPSTPALLPAAASIDIPVFLFFPHLPLLFREHPLPPPATHTHTPSFCFSSLSILQSPGWSLPPSWNLPPNVPDHPDLHLWIFHIRCLMAFIWLKEITRSSVQSPPRLVLIQTTPMSGVWSPFYKSRNWGSQGSMTPEVTELPGDGGSCGPNPAPSAWTFGALPLCHLASSHGFPCITV